VSVDAARELAELARDAVTDPHARDALLRELYTTVRKHVFFTIGGGALADDAVQETMIALYRGLPKFRGEANPRTWALTIASRTALRVRRREARHVPVEEIDAQVLDRDPMAAAELVLLGRALDNISEKKRDAFVLMSLLELTADEAGEALGIPANTAASRDRHARSELETVFAEERVK
jgi:RNA polymerase sigma-70 factor (ECF subfamily)